jgi:hypothetical protein
VTPSVPKITPIGQNSEKMSVPNWGRRVEIPNRLFESPKDKNIQLNLSREVLIRFLQMNGR